MIRFPGLFGSIDISPFVRLLSTSVSKSLGSQMSSPVAVGNVENESSLNPWVLPERCLSVYYGCPEMPRLSHYFLPRILLAEKRILYLDGANQISPLLIARFARQRGLEPS